MAADDLIDEQAFADDERLPYWADLWPSARALARYLLDHPPCAGAESKIARAIELGCGAAALGSLALARLGLDALATDYEPTALRYAEENARRSAETGAGCAQRLRTMLVDWRDVASGPRDFDLIIAADVLYEQRNAIALADFVPRVIAEHGRMLLADPGRRFLPEFQRRMAQRGFGACDRAMIIEPQDDITKPPSRVRIIEFAADRSPRDRAVRESR
jgi:predicted nicotinamide N-methyase